MEANDQKELGNQPEHIETSGPTITWTEEEEKALVKKIDLFLMPTIWLMYLLSYMDRTNIGNAKIAGMADDIGLSSSQYSIVLVVFFIGYVLFEPPSNMILVRARPSLYLPFIMALWGVLTCIMSVVKEYHHLIVLRVFVGIMESGFAPGILLIISSWYRRGEQSRRFAVFMSAAILSGAFGGLLAGAITSGLEDEKLGKGKSFMLALRDWRTWGFIFGYMVIVGSSTLSYFYPTLVHGLGFTSTVQAQYMTVPIYAFAFVCTAITGYFGDKIPDHRGLVIAAWLAFSMITSIIVCVVYNFTARYILLVLMAAGLWASNAMSLSFASSTFGSMDAEVRAIALALMNALGNLAQIYGAYLFPTDDAPKYLMGFGVISGMLGFGTVVYVIMHILVRRWKP
ncbi:hypothetical protein K4K54_001608 [Colletotrichum sp. SAR 10_86]|nr:hypothetical protein K4K54_001608 [Colletotrichum sp. SAR 10_86]